jgi:hypothetical protein
MFDSIAERKIAEAIAAGELDNLPGAGQPLELDDDSHVPEDLRAAYRILKNAGCVPPEVQMLKKIALLRMAAESRADRRPARISRRRG